VLKSCGWELVTTHPKSIPAGAWFYRVGSLLAEAARRIRNGPGMSNPEAARTELPEPKQPQRQCLT